MTSVNHSKLKPPINQRRFVSGWHELDYLCKKIRFWLYARQEKTRAQRYANRLERVLRRLPDDDMAIIRQEGLALLHELEGEMGKAIIHRRREIELIEWLHREVQSPTMDARARAYILQGRGVADLRRRQTILRRLLKWERDHSK